jgi:hypothetical protein
MTVHAEFDQTATAKQDHRDKNSTLIAVAKYALILIISSLFAEVSEGFFSSALVNKRGYRAFSQGRVSKHFGHTQLALLRTFATGYGPRVPKLEKHS